MVSLEERMEYVSRIQNNPKLKAFYDLLFLRKSSFLCPDEPNEIDQTYFGVVQAILDNNEASFDYYFKRLSKRIPNKDAPAPFIHNDLLIFSLILGVVKFKADRRWMHDVVAVRNRTGVTITFQNILNDDYYSNSNSLGLVVAFLSIINTQLLTDDFLNRAYSSIVEQDNIFGDRNDLTIITSLKAFDTVIALKSKGNSHRLQVLDKFAGTFLKRISLISTVLYNLIILLLVWFLYKLLKSYPEIQDQVNTLALIFGVVGISILNLISSFKNIFKRLLLYAFGYPKELDST
ncbi:hypothetical protein CLV24_12170 [Pontibacter ummariensis]|uniref:Uncharacterized protein n=1 Tax=Pontibacter ummariensis TaxID=1610492 RepID=A0A239JDY6_9BACT|nr:hypothetical protein [Pontibacter ummariensis]PRY08383.1 hypothetical protein CLV24_12170 [Pontibacter ummariensis]SNT04111.1 hypothetical protein SAMN06296052_12170 [Pontibacter ummariensis]